MLRMTQRRTMVDKSRRAGEGRITRTLSPLFARRFAALKRELRRANLRKRLTKADGLYKDNGADWAAWAQDFEDALSRAMMSVIDGLYKTENDFWQSRGKPPKTWDSRETLERYQTRIGRRIKDIADDTLKSVQDDIAKWYDSEDPLPDLIETLSQYFSTARAEAIAATEATGLASQVAYDMMNYFGIKKWRWDAILDWAVCAECAGVNGQTFDTEDNDAYPPLHVSCRCGIFFLEEEGEAA